MNFSGEYIAIHSLAALSLLLALYTLIARFQAPTDIQLKYKDLQFPIKGEIRVSGTFPMLAVLLFSINWPMGILPIFIGENEFYYMILQFLLLLASTLGAIGLLWYLILFHIWRLVGFIADIELDK